MKSRILCIFWGIFLSGNTGFCQENFQNVEEPDWSNIISYTAGKITDLYIQEYLGKASNGKNNAEAESYFEFKEELAYNSLQQPINPATLQDYLEPQFKITNEKLTTRILSWKDWETKNVPVLFDSLSNLLVERKSDIQEGKEYKVLKAEILYGYDKNEFPPQSQPVAEEVSNFDAIEPKVKFWGNLLLFQILSGILLLSTIICLIGWIHNRKLARSFKSEIKQLKKDKETTALPENGIRTRSIYSERKTEEKNLKREESKRVNSSPEVDSALEKDLPKEHSEQKDNIPTAPAEEPVPQVLFTGKPTPQREFQELQKDKEENHIYKLTLLDDINAEFELVELSSYMKTEVINSPDDYLYRVCHHENDNTEYTNEIVTMKKGTAQKIDSKWQVNEENKAIIKFQ